MTSPEEMAKATARLALQPLLMRPAGERIAAVTMMLQLVMMTDVRADRRLEFFEDLVDKLRNDLVNDLNKKVPNGKDGDKRGHRSKAARKKGRR